MASSGMSWSTDGTYSNPGEGTIGTQFPYPALALFRRNTEVLSSAFGYFAASQLNLTVNDETEPGRGQYVAGRQWDLTGGLCLALDHCYTGPLSWKLA